MPLDGRIQDFVPAEVEEVDEVGKVLLKAAQIVRERWLQGQWGQQGVPRCALGAIEESSGLNYCEAKAKLFRIIGVNNARDAIEWNNAPGRTAEQVAQAMEAAARMKD